MVDLAVHITNHSPTSREFTVTPKLPVGMTLVNAPAKLQIPSGKLGKVPLRVNTGSVTGNHLITADVMSEGMEFRNWIEALITVE